MKNKHEWVPTKFLLSDGELYANHRFVSKPSMIIANNIAKFYNENIKKYVRGQLLDLGCGRIPLYEAYKDFVDDNICVDWSKNNQHIDFSVDLNQELPFNNDQFDTIILSDVLEHIHKPFMLFREMNRVLQNNGVALINVPFLYMIHEHPHDYYRYTHYILKKIIKDSNFKLVSIVPLGGLLEVLMDFLGRFLYKVPFGKTIFWVMNKIYKLISRTKIGKSFLINSSEYYPHGYGIVIKK